ncbi:MAG: chemotaxis protein CheA [Proteobacteria bacterium]|nr:chemotaxis protein CheA [Pseudomonadota bacterium]
MAVDLNQFHQTFFEESLESINDMEAELLHIDGQFPSSGVITALDPIREPLNTIFRAAHSIKGGASTFGFEQITDFTHILETLLDNMRDGLCKTTKNTVTVLLQSADIMRNLFDAAQSGQTVALDAIRPVKLKLEEFAAASMGADSTRETGESQQKSNISDTASGWAISFTPHKELFLTGNDPLRIIRAISSLGDTEVKPCYDKLPSLGRMDPESCYLSWEIKLNANVAKTELEQIFAWVEDDCDLTIEPVAGPDITSNKAGNKSPATQETPVAGALPSSSSLQSIRVNTNKIDDLVDLVGELVITQTMLNRFNGELTPEDYPKLWASLTQLERNTRSLQESVMNIRMLPIGFAFNKLPRVVRDVSQQMGKSVALKMSGESTELDKSIIESIGDALLHIVRNSTDHGIESPSERKRLGKPETGTISINAFQQGGSVIIEIQDDGQGLQTDKILQKAIDRKLVSADARLSDDEISNIIFMPGFSTATTVTGVSGRGVGLDVVRTNLAKMGGGVELENKPGIGTRFRLRVPLTLAIMDGLCVQVGSHIYITPLLSVRESICLTQEQVSQPAGGSEIFHYNDQHLPLLRLSELFNIDTAIEDISQGIVVVIESDNQNIGILVDNILGQQQVVVKSLETHYKKVEGIATATILGDGEVALILDISSLSQLVGKNTATQNSEDQLFAGEQEIEQ